MSSRPDRKKAWKKRLEETRKRALIESIINSFPVRHNAFSSLVAPLRARMDYQSIARKTFLMEEMPKCGQCGGYVGQNAKAGCRECMAGEVMGL